MTSRAKRNLRLAAGLVVPHTVVLELGRWDVAAAAGPTPLPGRV